MRHRPTDLPPSERDERERYFDELETRVHDAVESLLLEVDTPQLRQQLYAIAFNPSDALPKRTRRQHLPLACVAEQTYLSASPDGERLETVLGAVSAVSEYYDIFDDLVDGDVADDRRREVVLTTQALMPLFVRLLARLGTDAVEHWSERAVRLVEAPLAELLTEPDPERYFELLDTQAELFGGATGAAALAGEADEDAVDRAVAMGKLLYKFDQVLLDCEQYHDGDDDPWNAWRLTDDETVHRRLESWRREVETLADALPGRRAGRVRWTVAVDVEAFERSVAGE